MNRYEEVEAVVFKDIEDNCFGNRKRHGYRHLFGVKQLCLLYSKHYNLDPELCAIMGLLHDYSVYKFNNRFEHAHYSSELASRLLNKLELFNDDEIQIIVCAIKNHSNKDRRDDDYSELLKLCDVVDSYLNDPDTIVSKDRQYYLNLYKQL